MYNIKKYVCDNNPLHSYYVLIYIFTRLDRKWIVCIVHNV